MGSSSNSPDQKMNVYIWDMDETLILLKSLINRTYAEAHNGSKNAQEGEAIGTMWENHILQLCDDHFFYEEIENYNQPHLDAMSPYDDAQNLSGYDFSKDGLGPSIDDLNKRKLAYRHRVIAEKYRQGLQGIVNEDMIKFLDNLYDTTDSYTDRWLSSARACLKQCALGSREVISYIALPDTSSDQRNTSHHNVNILVTSGALIPSLVKCLLFKLDDLITCENVFSSWDVGKLQCFKWIRERFSSPNVQFCVIGDGWEECEAAEAMKWPFVKIEPRPDGYHRFPGLTLRDLDPYISVIYNNGDAQTDAS